MIWRIRSKRVFRRLHAEGRRTKSGPVRMTYLPIESEQPQLALAIGRRFGNAVERNRARRRVRHAFAEAWSASGHPAEGGPGTLRPEGAFLVTGSRALLTMPNERLVESVGRCLRSVSVEPTEGGPGSGAEMPERS